MNANSLPSLARFFFFSCLFLSHRHACEATIYTFSNISSSSISPPQHHQEHENDYAILRDAFPSLPGLFGGEMQDNTLYRARLQFIRDNSYLCQDEQDAESRTYHDPKMGSFVLPPDYQQAIDTANNNTNTTSPNHNFVPVALLAARGFCPFFNKAVVAESFGQAVQFLIVYNNDIDGEDVLVPMYSEYGNTRLILLSVTHRTGQALKRYIAAQSHDVIAAGGPLIEFDNLPPEGILTVQDLQNYVLSALGLFFMFVSLSGCFLIWVGRRGGGPSTRIILVAGEMPAVATVSSSSSSRRVLTTGQIQLLVQATRQQKQQAAVNGEVDETIGAASLTTVSAHEDDCCAVCMEDFEHDADQSEHNLTLPCGHLFHKDCKLFEGGVRRHSRFVFFVFFFFIFSRWHFYFV